MRQRSFLQYFIFDFMLGYTWKKFANIFALLHKSKIKYSRSCLLSHFNFFEFYDFYFRPIFIVNTVHDGDSDSEGMGGITETDSSQVTQRVVMEINNNNSSYLPHEEDKYDKVDKGLQCENVISRVVFSRERIVEKSLRKIIEVKTMSEEITGDKHVNLALDLDSDESSQSHNEPVTLPSDDNIPKVQNELPENSPNAEKLIDFDEVINIDSEGLEAECVGESLQFAITTSEVPLINEQNREVTQSMGESEFVLFYK